MRVTGSEAANPAIFIVDDQEVRISLFAQRSGNAGYARIASSRLPPQACAQRRTLHCARFLLDLQSPGMNEIRVSEGLMVNDADGGVPAAGIIGQPAASDPRCKMPQGKERR